MTVTSLTDLPLRIGRAGTFDAASAITAAITVAAGKARLIIPPGQYRIDTPLSLTGLDGVTISAHGATFVFNKPVLFQRCLSFISCTNVRIAGLRINGNKAVIAAGITGTDGNGYDAYAHNLFFQGCADVWLEDLILDDAYGDGLSIADHSAGVLHNSRFHVRGVRAHGCERQGMFITDLADSTFEGCSFNSTLNDIGGTESDPHIGVDIEPNYDTSIIDNLRFVGCDFSDNDGAGFQVRLRAIPSAVQRGIRLVGCTAHANGEDGFRFETARGVELTGCAANDNAWSGIAATKYVDGLAINGGTFSRNANYGIGAVIPNTTTDGYIRHLKVIGATVVDNGSASAGTYSGIKVDPVNAGSSASDVAIIGTTSRNQETVNQKYGIETSAQVSKLTLGGNDVSVNVQATRVSLNDDQATRHDFGNVGASSFGPTPPVGFVFALPSVGTASQYRGRLMRTTGAVGAADGLAFAGKRADEAVYANKVPQLATIVKTHDFASIAAQASAETTVTIDGARAGNHIIPAWPSALPAGLVGVMYVSADNTVTIRVSNPTSAAIDPGSLNYGVAVVL
jgi:hypothetical protein